MKKTIMLKKNYEFKRVLSKGKYFSGKNIEAFILDNNRKMNFLGLAISVKVGKSVRRNNIKRLIRENYYRLEEVIKTGKSIVFLWNKKADVSNANFYSIKEDMENIFKKANMFEIGNIYEKNVN